MRIGKGQLVRTKVQVVRGKELASDVQVAEQYASARRGKWRPPVGGRVCLVYIIMAAVNAGRGRSVRAIAATQPPLSLPLTPFDAQSPGATVQRSTNPVPAACSF